MKSEKRLPFAPSRYVAIVLLVLGMASLEAHAATELKLAAPFADHMVLQREMEVPVWGWAEPGGEITVAFGGQTKTTTPGDDGKWMVKLDPLEASFDSRELTVSGGGSSVTISDVLVGEVWLASGQSNMQWVASKSDVGRTLIPRIKEKAEAGEIKLPTVREGKVVDFYATAVPIKHATVEWSDDWMQGSAVCMAFALTVAEELDVPVGMLNCAFSTTQIQTWIPKEGFAAGEDEYTKGIYQKILEGTVGTDEHNRAWAAFYQQIEDTIEQNKKLVAEGKEPVAISTELPGNYSGNRDATWMYNARISPLIPYAIRGGIWNQGYASQSEGLRYYENLHSLIRGWRTVFEQPDLPVYFHQFYRGGNSHDGSLPSLDSTNEMRLATWLAAKDIPNADFASQIDIGGAIHYGNKSMPGIRFAKLALKNQYGKDIVANGPLFKSYTVDGDKVVVDFEHAEQGLVIAKPDEKNLATAQLIPDGEDQVKLFYIADEEKVWYPATFKIDGSRVVVTAEGVDEPRGIAYAVSGVGFQPNLYNKALFPTTPFIYYDNELVTSETWDADTLVVHGVEPPVAGLEYDYRKMPLLSTQFRSGAVLQADVPVTLWGSAVHRWVHNGAREPIEGDARVNITFGDIKHSIKVEDGMYEWQYQLPAMPASEDKHTIHVTFTVDGEVIHERLLKDVVFGDVWYVSAPDDVTGIEAPETKHTVRFLARGAKRTLGSPSRFSIATSTQHPDENRFAAQWKPATGLAAALGNRLAEQTGRPVGIIFMDSASGFGTEEGPELKSWIPAEALKNAPSLMADYEQLASLEPGNEYYDANARRYAQAWKDYWGKYVPEMIATEKVPDGAAWGGYPRFAADVETKASQSYNIMTYSFTPAALKGVVFIPDRSMFVGDNAKHYGEQLAALANSWKQGFGTPDPRFIYVQPTASVASGISSTTGIEGESQAIEVNDWPAASDQKNKDADELTAWLSSLAEKIVQAAAE